MAKWYKVRDGMDRVEGLFGLTFTVTRSPGVTQACRIAVLNPDDPTDVPELPNNGIASSLKEARDTCFELAREFHNAKQPSPSQNYSQRNEMAQRRHEQQLFMQSLQVAAQVIAGLPGAHPPGTTTKQAFEQRMSAVFTLGEQIRSRALSIGSPSEADPPSE